MLCSTFLIEVEERLRNQAARARVFGHQFSDQQMNWKAESQHWSIGQILEHMHLADAKYLEPLKHRIETASYGKDREIRNTLVGSLLIKGNAPNANTPAPKILEPGKGPYTKAIAEKVASEYEAFSEMVGRCKEVDLVVTKMPNPFAPIIKMNLVDAFALIAVHADRHLGQIDHISRRTDFPK